MPPITKPGYNPRCPDGRPHYRICGDETIKARVPDFFKTHAPAPRGCTWQVCLNCGDAFYSSLDPEDGQIAMYAAGPQLRTEKTVRAPGEGGFSMQNKGKPPAHNSPGYVTTTVAAARLKVGRPTIREYIRSGRLEAKREVVKGSSIYLVTIASLSRELLERFGRDIASGIVAGLWALDKQAFGELSKLASEAEKPLDGQGGLHG